jgi:NAD(P)-dependent dehydrogenase (short-subunit alcohol dehydrogenase family)
VIDKTCLITGGTSGIGKAAALALASLGHGLIILGRNAEKLERTCREIRLKTGNDRVDSCACDISVMADVRAAADRIKAGHDTIDVLVNSAGARFLRHGVTREGVELTLATNHLGHYVLTLSLTDLLDRSGVGRVVNVSSGTHRAAAGVIENVLSARDYDGRRQYAESKLANILFTYALAVRLKGRGISVNSADPGGVATNFARNNGLLHWLKHRLYYMSKRQLLSPAQGAETIVFLASSNEVQGVTGKHYFQGKAVASSKRSYDAALQDELWSSSARLSGIDLQAAGHER